MKFADFLNEMFDVKKLPAYNHLKPSHGEGEPVDGNTSQYRVGVSRDDTAARQKLLSEIKKAGWKIEGFNKVNHDIDSIVITRE